MMKSAHTNDVGQLYVTMKTTPMCPPITHPTTTWVMTCMIFLLVSFQFILFLKKINYLFSLPDSPRNSTTTNTMHSYFLLVSIWCLSYFLITNWLYSPPETTTGSIWVFHLLPQSESRTHLLPPNLLKPFAPRQPLHYSQPLDRDIDRIQKHCGCWYVTIFFYLTSSDLFVI